MGLGQRLIELRKSKQLSQEEVADKLNVTRQTISKWETDQSSPEFDKIIPLCELFETPVSEILGESIEEKETNDLKVISEKLEVINEQLSISQKQKRTRKIMVLLIIDICLIFFFVLLALLGSPYLTWDYGNPEWSVIGTLWHSFEWIFFRIAPLLIIIITVILIILFIKREK